MSCSNDFQLKKSNISQITERAKTLKFNSAAPKRPQVPAMLRATNGRPGTTLTTPLARVQIFDK